MRKDRNVGLGMVLMLVMLVPAVALGDKIQLPQSGQQKCYNATGAEIPCAGTGQDGEIRAGAAWPAKRFADKGDGTMLDRLTGLNWSKEGNVEIPECSQVISNWQQTIDRVTCLNTHSYLGYDDWRLPNVNEMESLRNSGMRSTRGWLQFRGFTNVQPQYVLSTYESIPDWTAWYLNTTDMRIFPSDGFDITPPVWPVRGGANGDALPGTPAQVWRTGQTISSHPGDDGDLEYGVAWPSPRFVTVKAGVIKDQLTELMWTRNANSPGASACGTALLMNWLQSLDYIKCLNAGNYLGYSDWRLPNRVELHSLTDFSQSDPALPASHPFIHVQSADYWSSTSHAAAPSLATVVDMGSGRISNSGKGTLHRVWPVRSGIVMHPSDLALSAAPVSSSRIALSWSDTASDELGFIIERKQGDCTSSDPWRQIARRGANQVKFIDSGLTPDTIYSYRMRAYNASGFSAYSSCAQARTNTTGGPAAPVDLVAVSQSNNRIDLSWKHDSGGATYFVVFRRDCLSCPWDTRTTVDASIETFSDTSAYGNSLTSVYSYSVQACNASACSPPTEEAVVPLQPTDLKANPLDFVDLTWQDNSSNETGFEIYRQEAACGAVGLWHLLETVGPNVEGYLDSSAVSGTFAYKVRAYHRSDKSPYAYGYSSWSNCAQGDR